MFGKLLSALRGGATPPVHPDFRIVGDDLEENAPEEAQTEPGLHPIAGFTCVIDHVGTGGQIGQRLITCRTLEVRGEQTIIFATCHVSKGLRRFDLDRVAAVYDARTGEQLGAAGFFGGFDVDERVEGTPRWGLSRPQRTTLLAGLTILAFMARCDGEWHELEEPVFVDFVARLWSSEGWPGEPPVSEIMEHVRNLAPDQDAFFGAVDVYAQSKDRRDQILRSASEMIQADEVISPEEFNWYFALEDAFAAAGQRRMPTSRH